MRFLVVTQSYAMELKIVYCSTESSKLSSTRKIVWVMSIILLYEQVVSVIKIKAITRLWFDQFFFIRTMCTCLFTFNWQYYLNIEKSKYPLDLSVMTDGTWINAFLASQICRFNDAFLNILVHVNDLQFNFMYI